MTKRSIPRSVRIAVIVLALAAVATLALTNLLLMTRLGSTLVSSEHVTITWRTGWAIWPTRIHLRDVEVDARSAARPIHARAEKVDGTLSLGDFLAGRTTVHDAVAEHVRSARVGPVTFIGDAVLRGDFSFDDSGDVHAEALTADTQSGVVRLEQAPFLEDLRAHFVLASSAAETMSGGLELEANVASGGFLRPVTTGAPDLRGHLRTSLRIVDGVLAPSSTAELRTMPARSSVVLGVDASGNATLTALLHDVVWKGDRLGEPPVNVAEARAHLQSPKVRIAAPLEGATGDVDLRGIEVDAARAPFFATFLGHPATLRGDAHASVAHGAVEGRVDLRAEDAVVAIGSATRRGRLDVHADVKGERPDSKDLRLTAQVEHHWDGGHGSVTIDDATLKLDDGRGAGTELDGAMLARASDALLVFDALVGPGALPLPVALVVQTQPLEWRGHVHLEGDDVLVIRDIEGHAGPVSIRGRYDRAAATLLVESGPLAVGVAKRGGTTDLVFIDARRWFEEAMKGQPTGSGS